MNLINLMNYHLPIEIVDLIFDQYFTFTELVKLEESFNEVNFYTKKKYQPKKHNLLNSIKHDNLNVFKWIYKQEQYLDGWATRDMIINNYLTYSNYDWQLLNATLIPYIDKKYLSKYKLKNIPYDRFIKSKEFKIDLHNILFHLAYLQNANKIIKWLFLNSKKNIKFYDSMLDSNLFEIKLWLFLGQKNQEILKESILFDILAYSNLKMLVWFLKVINYNKNYLYTTKQILHYFQLLFSNEQTTKRKLPVCQQIIRYLYFANIPILDNMSNVNKKICNLKDWIDSNPLDLYIISLVNSQQDFPYYKLYISKEILKKIETMPTNPYWYLYIKEDDYDKIHEESAFCESSTSLNFDNKDDLVSSYMYNVPSCKCCNFEYYQLSFYQEPEMYHFITCDCMIDKKIKCKGINIPEFEG